MDSSQKEHLMQSSTPILIPKKEDYQHGLKQNFFNPSKESPPNMFLINLNTRLNEYYEPRQVPSYNKSDS